MESKTVGKYLKELRIENIDVLVELAKRYGVSIENVDDVLTQSQIAQLETIPEIRTQREGIRILTNFKRLNDRVARELKRISADLEKDLPPNEQEELESYKEFLENHQQSIESEFNKVTQNETFNVEAKNLLQAIENYFLQSNLDGNTEKLAKLRATTFTELSSSLAKKIQEARSDRLERKIEKLQARNGRITLRQIKIISSNVEKYQKKMDKEYYKNKTENSNTMTKVRGYNQINTEIDAITSDINEIKKEDFFYQVRNMPKFASRLAFLKLKRVIFYGGSLLNRQATKIDQNEEDLKSKISRMIDNHLEERGKEFYDQYRQEGDRTWEELNPEEKEQVFDAFGLSTPTQEQNPSTPAL